VRSIFFSWEILWKKRNMEGGRWEVEDGRYILKTEGGRWKVE
jgi:hypothetical protein